MAREGLGVLKTSKSHCSREGNQKRFQMSCQAENKGMKGGENVQKIRHITQELFRGTK